MAELVSEVKSVVDRVEVVGVNTDACVVQTAVGIAKNNPELAVDVLEDSCNSASHDFEAGGLELVHAMTIRQIESYGSRNKASNLRLVPEDECT